MHAALQTALDVIFPPSCVACGATVDENFALCSACWAQTPFITGLVCDTCGVPLHGSSDDHPAQCDDCLARPRPWRAGRAALLYRDAAKKLVLSLKNGHRMSAAHPAGIWLERAGTPLLQPDIVILPVPLHWTRLFKRTFNQSVLLARALAQRTGHEMIPDLLLRHRPTQSLGTKSAADRFAVLEDSISIRPKDHPHIAGRPVLLIDDVFTSGATLSVATQACLEAGASDVFVLTLARVAKDA